MRKLSTQLLIGALFCGLALSMRATVRADSFADVSKKVNKRMVKLFGSGGFKGLVSYGSGVLVSPQGHILTSASPMLDTKDLRVHLYDGRRYHATVLYTEPTLDMALVKINSAVDGLDFYDITEAAKQPLAQEGDWILGFSNQFEIATRNEPMTVQRGVVAAYADLQARRGVFAAPYQGKVYIIDAITNNPGGAGGALTTRDGKLLGIVGKELRNTLTDTWINYATPIQPLEELVVKGIKGEYKTIEKKPLEGTGGFHGIVTVPDVVERTPPYVEDVEPESPADKAGLRTNDLIVYLDGGQVVSVKAFKEMIAQYKPGTPIKLEVRRSDKDGGATKLVTVEFKLGPPKKQ